jgi:hypothetical protein
LPNARQLDEFHRSLLIAAQENDVFLQASDDLFTVIGYEAVKVEAMHVKQLPKKSHADLR